MSEGAIEQVTDYIGNLETEVEIWKQKCLEAQGKLKDHQKSQNEIIKSARKELLQHCLSIRDAIEAVEKGTQQHSDSVINMIKDDTIQNLDLKDLRQLSQMLSVKLGLRASLFNVKSDLCCDVNPSVVNSPQNHQFNSYRSDTERSETCVGPIERIKKFVDNVCCGLSNYNFANESAENDALSPSNKQYTERAYCPVTPLQQKNCNAYPDDNPSPTNTQPVRVNRTDLTNSNPILSNLSNKLLAKSNSNSNEASPIAKTVIKELNTNEKNVFSRRVSTGRDKSSARGAQPPPVPLLDFSKLY